MFILTIRGQEEEGAYAVADQDGERALYMLKKRMMQLDMVVYWKQKIIHL